MAITHSDWVLKLPIAKVPLVCESLDLSVTATDKNGTVWIAVYVHEVPMRVDVTDEWDDACDAAKLQGHDAASRCEVRNKDVLCPYPIGNSLRIHWFIGLLDAQYSAKYAVRQRKVLRRA